MKKLVTLAALVALVATPSQAADTKPPASQGDDSFAALMQAYEGARDAWMKETELAVKGAKTSVEIQKARKAYQFKEPHFTVEFSPRFLAFAEKHPDNPDAIDALTWTFQTSADRDGKVLDTRLKALKLLNDRYVTCPKLTRRLLDLVSALKDKEAQAFLEDVTARNPERKIQALALRSRADVLEAKVRIADRFEQPSSRAQAETWIRRERLAELVADGIAARHKAEPLRAILRERYADVLPPVAVGEPIPYLVGETLDGKPDRLADRRGKVVVLDVWATTCGPCKEMIPYEREMVARLKGKPFELISISGDDEKQTLQQFLTKVPMPWTHWWCGQDKKIIEQLDVHLYPAIFVIDAKGVVRYIGLRGAELEKAVNTLLDEATKKPASAA